MNREHIDGFVKEIFDLLDDVEPQLIKLSEQGAGQCAFDEDILNSVFRVFHTIKGGAGFLGLDTVSGVTHEVETLLDFFRNSQVVLNATHVQTLCETIDFIRILANTIVASGTDEGHDEDARRLMDRLHVLVSDVLSTSGPAHSSTGNRGAAQDPALQADLPSPSADSASAPGQDRGNGLAEAGHGPDQSGMPVTVAMRTSYGQEAEDALDSAEQTLLAMNVAASREDQAGQLSATFRALHSLKGNSGFMGFADMETLAHRMENALELMREGTVAVKPEMVGLLLKMIDVLRGAVRQVAGGGQGNIKGLDIYLHLLNDTMPSPTVPQRAARSPHPPDAARPAPDIPPKKAMPVKPSSPALPIRQDIRVDIQKLDALVNLVGELVIAESMVTRHPHVAGAEIENLERATHLLRRVSRDLQDVVMSARMIPLAGTFRKMIRLVHDLACKSGKQIALKLLGEATEVDKTVIEQIGDPLVHIIRNAADHGIEMPKQRKEAGKNEQATITVEGRHEGGEVWILISDDGRGLNRERILGKARENGLVNEDAEKWPDERVFRLIFEPGFSTAEQVTDVSGRGVGMDVVRKNIEKLKGRIDIRSRPGLDSTFILRIPLTLAIIEGMMVRVGEARYTIPLLAIRESLRPEPTWITVTPDGQETVRIRDDFYPILRLHRRFNKTPDHLELHEGILVLVECDRRVIALFVDEILGRQETVIKGLSDYLGQSPGVSGCTILGDGEVSLILDVAGLVEERGAHTAA